MSNIFHYFLLINDHNTEMIYKDFLYPCLNKNIDLNILILHDFI